MFLVSKPDTSTIEHFLLDCETEAFSYRHVGATRTDPPSGFDVDHSRKLIGRGSGDYFKAKRAVDEWKMFDIPWIGIHWKESQAREGMNVALVAKHLGFYSINCSRVVYVFDEEGPVERYGFAYGTLLSHNECGEERFTVEFDSKSEEVWYDLYAFSKPRHPLARLGYFYSRYLQREFRFASMDAMRRAIATSPNHK